MKEWRNPFLTHSTPALRASLANCAARLLNGHTGPDSRRYGMSHSLKLSLIGTIRRRRVILRVKTRHFFAGQNHPPRGGVTSYEFSECLQEVWL
jgi:hypothetical protein